MRAPICPKCGSEAIEVQSRWGKKHVCCDLWSYGGKPLVDRATHQARIAAHAAFDPLWNRHGFARSEAYRLLAEELNIPGEECHMGSMPLPLLKLVPGAALRIMQRGRPPESEERKRRQAITAALPKCACGNIIGKRRFEAGNRDCPACERAHYACDEVT